MAKYKETVHTDKAFALIGKMVAGKISELEFTKIKVSDKDYSKHTAEELKKLTALEQIKQETEVSEKTLAGDNAVNVHGIIYNTDLQNSYYLRTLGLYANDPDEGEILYSVTATEVGDYIPTPDGNNITTAIIDILTEISDAEVNLSGNPSALVDVSMLNKKLDRGEGLEKEFDSAVKIVTELKKKQNKEDSTLKTVVKTIVGAINELFDNKLEKGGYTGTAQNLLTEISKIASKSVLGRIIIGKGISVDSFGRTSIVSKNDGIIVNENDIHLDTVDNVTTDSGTKPLSARQGKKLDENKQNKNDNTLKTTAKNIVGAINELFIELWKTGSTTQFGRFKVGKNLSVDENGFLNGNPQYTHPTGNGNSHLPSGGAAGQFIKWLSAGVGQWASITWSDITGKPSSFTPSSHKHTKAEITDFAHTHPEYITSAQIEEKFKIFCPFPVGSVLPMWNENNPTTLYLGTTWELITAGKYIQSGSTPLSVGGNNSISITKANLPNIKLKVDSFSVTTQKHSHPVTSKGADGDGGWDGTMFSFTPYGNSSSKTLYTDNAGGQNTGIASPNTEVLGSGTALNIQPAYITLKFWKRLT